MPNSINTNVAAMVALRNLNSINLDLETAQNRVSTGLKVSSAEDNASVFSVAQGIRANLVGYEAVNGALNGAKAIMSVSIGAMTSISDLMASVREKLTQLTDESLSSQQRTVYTQDLRGQIEGIRNYLNQAVYNGSNLLMGKQSSSATSNDQLTGSFYSSAGNIKVIQDLAGNQLTIRSADLMNGGDTSGTGAGWLALARLVYHCTTGAVTTASTNAVDLSSTGALAVNGSFKFIARSSVTASMARAALADVTETTGTRQTGVYFSTPTATAGVDSVFNSAWAIFNREIGIKLGTQGTDNKAIDLLTQFNDKIRDASEMGLGTLIDADLARESARLQAAQTRQQFALQALSIANSAPQGLLSLFR